MEDINIVPLYNIIISDLKITDETLKIFGYNEEIIYMLIEWNIIQRLKNDEYKLVSVEKFRQYGRSLLLANKKGTADKVFEICYEIAPNAKNIAPQYIHSLLKRRKYNEIFDVIDKVNSESNDVNYNLYLYLLSFLLDIPDKYRNKIKNINESNLLKLDTGHNRLENKIRKKILENKFKYAYQLINDTLAKTRDSGYSLKFELIREFLKQVVNCETKHKENLKNLIKESQYKEVALILRNRQEIRGLSIVESNMLIVADAIVEILETGKVPMPTATIYDIYDMRDALKSNNFKIALELNAKFMEETAKNKDDDIFNLLLVELDNIISNLVENDNQKEQYGILGIDKYINDAIEMAYYISMEGITLEEATKKFGLKKELVLLIKLIYARDYYKEGKFDEGDYLVKCVEESPEQTYQVLLFLDEVRECRNSEKKSGKMMIKHTKA